MMNDAYVSEETDQNTANERLDLSRFEGHTPGPWDADYGPIVATLDEGDSTDVLTIRVPTSEDYEVAWTNQHLAAAAPDLLADIKRLEHRLMLAESALGEIRVYHESGQGDLGEIIEHYQENEQVEMPSLFDED